MSHESLIEINLRGAVQTFPKGKTIIFLYVNRPEMSHIRTEVDRGGFVPDRMRIYNDEELMIKLSGLAIPSDILTPLQVTEMAEELDEHVPIYIDFDPPEDVIRGNPVKHTEEDIARRASEIAIHTPDKFPEVWTHQY